MSEFIEVGIIENTHGIKGEMKIGCYLDSPYMMTNIPKYYINSEEYKKESLRVHKGRALLKLSGINDMTTAESFKNKKLFALKEDIKLEKNSYFVDDIIGVTVFDAETGKKYGKIYDVMFTGANDVYCIEGEEREYLIPAIKDCIKAVDLENKTMKIKVLDGLFDL